MNKQSVLASCALLATSGIARGQLVVGNGQAGGDVGAYLIDVQNGDTTPLWPAITVVNGLAVDNDNKRVYFSSLFVLRSWDFYAPAQGQIGPIPAGGVALGLTMAKGELYGFVDGGPQRGIIRIDTVTAASTAVLPLAPEWLFEGLAFNDDDGLFYGAQNSTAVHPLGLYSIDALGTGAITFVAAYPPELLPQVNGLAAGNGKLWLLKAGAANIHSFDLSTGTYDPPTLVNPVRGSAFGGADWAGRLYVPVGYCTAKVNSVGCTPAIGYYGHSSVSGASDFAITATNMRNQRPGLLLHGVQGRAALPFENGTLCLAGQVRRSPVLFSEGNPVPAVDCSGGYRIDMNALASGALGGNPIPQLSIPGTRIDCQWWARDDQAQIGFETSLSDALEYTVDV